MPPKFLLKYETKVIKEIPFPEEKTTITIGRKQDNDIVMDHPAISGHHAKIVKSGNSYIIEDLNSTNGTFIDGEKILKIELHHKTQVDMAKHSLVFINEEKIVNNIVQERRDKLILIVEDDESVQDFMKFTLEKENFKIITASDGEKAIEMTKLNNPDLIVLDMILPKKSGYEVIKNLQGIGYSYIPIVIVTGKSMDENFKNMLLFESNVKELIAKPIKPSHFTYRIHSILGTISPFQKIAEQKRQEIEEKIKPKPELI